MDSSNSTLGHEKIPWDRHLIRHEKIPWNRHLIRRGKSCKLLRITPTIPTAGHPSMLELGRVQPGLVFVSDDEIAEPDVLLNTKDDNAEMIWCLFTLN
jgi:hypothetical protein